VRKFNIFKRVMYTCCGLLTAGLICVQSGFISLAYPNNGVINDDGVNIRSAADSGSTDNVMKRADENMAVTVVGETTGSDGRTWLKVTFTDGGSEKTGFVREDFVTISQTEAPDEEQTPQTPDENKNPDGLTPIEGLDESLTCYFNIDGGHYFINQSFTDDMIPDGFTRVEADYRGDTIQVVKSNDIDFYLAYLTEYDDQTKSEWCFFDTEAGGFSYWIKLETMQGKYLYLIDTFGAGQMDFGYEKKDLEIDGKLVEAWQLMLEEEEDLTGENDCFYYVYGINQDGNKGLYSYYTKDGTYQRNILTGLEIVDDEYLSTEENTQLLEKQLKELRDKYSEDMSRRLTIICVLIVVCVLLLFVSIHLVLKTRRADEDEYEDDEDDDDYIEERPGFRNRAEAIGRGEKSRLEKIITEELDEETEEELDEEPLPEIMDITLDEIDDSGKDEMPVIQAPEDLFEEDDTYAEDTSEEDDYEEDEYEDDEEDEEEYVKPKRRGFFFGRRRDDDYDDEDDDEEDDYDDDEEDDYEDDEEDEEEYVKPKRRGFFFGRRRNDDYDDDDYEEDDEYEDDEYEDDDDYEEERMSWAESRRAKKEAKARAKEEEKARKARAKEEARERKAERRNRYEDEDEDADVRRSSKKSKAADYAERTVSAKKSSKIPEQVFDDDDFEFEFIDLDDDF